jgi:chemotaxis signal transduction protein
MRWLSFKIFNQKSEKDGRRFAIRESQAVESVPFGGVMPDSKAPPAVLGVMDYHGRPVRILDLGELMGLGSCELPQRARILVARHSRTSPAVGIAVQPELEEVSSLAAPGIEVVDLRLLSRASRPPRT